MPMTDAEFAERKARLLADIRYAKAHALTSPAPRAAPPPSLRALAARVSHLEKKLRKAEARKAHTAGRLAAGLPPPALERARAADRKASVNLDAARQYLAEAQAALTAEARQGKAYRLAPRK